MTQDAALRRVGELFSDIEAQAGSPKYLKLFEALLSALREGTLSPGDRLPTEIDIADSLPVSLGTVQKALNKLSEIGLVVRNRRSGTFVRDWQSRSEDALIYRFSDPKTGGILRPFTRAVAVTEDRSDGPWRAFLNTQKLVRFDRLLWVEQDPPGFSQVYFRYKHGKHLLRVPLEQLHGSSYHRILADSFGLPSTRTAGRVSVGALAEDACHYMRIAADTVGIIWDTEEYSFDDTPLVFQRIQLPPGHRPLEIDRGAPAKT